MKKNKKQKKQNKTRTETYNLLMYVKIVSLKPDMMIKNVFCDYRTFLYYC